MNDNMRKVLVALRSGEYKQTKEMLQDKNGYCCLGVMCAVFEKETGMTLRKKDDTGYIYGGDLSAHPHVREWVGLANESGLTKARECLIDFNDAMNYPFSEIADFIESEPKGLLL
jgi:hypothetical protein